MAVVDASVATKWFLAETDSPAALSLREEHIRGRIRLLAPDFLVYEVANALRYVPGIGQVDLEELSADLFMVGIGFDSVSEAVLIGALRAALRTGLTVYDAAYIALADRLDCDLVTADELQLRAAGPRGRHIQAFPGAG